MTRLVGEVADFVRVNAVPMGICLLLLLSGGGAYLASRFTRNEGKMQRDKAAKKQYIIDDKVRRYIERLAIGEMVADGLLRLHTKGELSAEGYRNWHLRFGAEFNLPDLLPGKLSAAELKTNLKKRRNGGSYHGTMKQVKLPGHTTEKGVNPIYAILMRRL